MDFMNREQWAEIYDIARYNGVAAHRLVEALLKDNPNASEQEIHQAAIKWSLEKSLRYGR